MQMGAGWRRSWLLVVDALKEIVVFELPLMNNVNTGPKNMLGRSIRRAVVTQVRCTALPPCMV